MHIPRSWYSLAIAVTLLCGLGYTESQQVLRQDANDPQLQMAQDAAAQIERGATPASLIGSTTADPANSLAPFMIIYDETGNQLATSTSLQTPVPSGVLDYARTHVDDRVTWQPASGVRIALVVVHATDGAKGFVAVGRSLKEVEVRETQAQTMALVVWAVTLALTLGASIVLSKKQS